MTFNYKNLHPLTPLNTINSFPTEVTDSGENPGLLHVTASTRDQKNGLVFSRTNPRSVRIAADSGRSGQIPGQSQSPAARLKNRGWGKEGTHV